MTRGTPLAFRAAARVLHKHGMRGDDQGMRARPNLTGDQLVQAYLSRVAEAARHLPKGARIAFVGRTRAQIEQQAGAEGMADPGKVAEVLAALGEPEELVRAERLRIDNRWLKNRGHDAGSEEATAAAVPASSPRVYRPLRSRWKPAAPVTRPLPRDDSTGPDDVQGHTVPQEPDPTVPPPWPGDLNAIMPPGPAVPERRPSRGHGPTPLDSVWQLARAHKLESIAVVVLGLGGLILPFPFWLAGAFVATFSRLFDGRDKTLAWLGPALFALVGSLVTALFMGGKQNPIMIYTGALKADFGLLVRFGCVLSAGYLAWRVRKGRRVKIPPWKR